jgi:hypothetical protein
MTSTPHKYNSPAINHSSATINSATVDAIIFVGACFGRDNAQTTENKGAEAAPATNPFSPFYYLCLCLQLITA